MSLKYEPVADYLYAFHLRVSNWSNHQPSSEVHLLHQPSSSPEPQVTSPHVQHTQWLRERGCQRWGGRLLHQPSSPEPGLSNLSPPVPEAVNHKP